LPATVVGFLEDDDVLKHADDAILSASPHLCDLMATLFTQGFRPIGQMPTLLFGLCLMANFYETVRMDGGEPQESMELAAALALRHPVIQKNMAFVAADAVDAAAGVSE